jgi:hypothetical protein
MKLVNSFKFIALLTLLLSSCSMPKGDLPLMETESVATRATLTLETLSQPAIGTQFLLTSSPSETRSIIYRTPDLTSTGMMMPSATLIPYLSPTNKNEPTSTPTITHTPQPSITTIPVPGTIAGIISGYPYGSIPRLAIVAFGQEPPYNYSYLIISAGSTYYSMTSDYLIPKQYQVVAYDPLGHSGGCTTFVLVISDQIVNCDIVNWGGGYPAKPASVPFP